MRLLASWSLANSFLSPQLPFAVHWGNSQICIFIACVATKKKKESLLTVPNSVTTPSTMNSTFPTACNLTMSDGQTIESVDLEQQRATHIKCADMTQPPQFWNCLPRPLWLNWCWTRALETHVELEALAPSVWWAMRVTCKRHAFLPSYAAEWYSNVREKMKS